LLEAGNDAQRLAVAHAVGDGLPKAMSMDRLLGALSAQSDAEVTTELTRSIEKVYGANGLQGISDLLNQASDPDQRQAMVHGLEHSWTHQPNQAQSLYMQVASLDPAPQVRGQAIDVIKQQNDPALIQSLEALYVAELDPSVRDQLLGAIRELESLR